jgi:OOP family OmpA-OmpF porin
MKRFTRKALPAAIGIAVGGLAAAPAVAGAGWYAGIGGGASTIDNFEGSAAGFQAGLEDDGLVATVDSLDIDDSDTGLKIFGGYEFNDYFALEAFYVDLGEFDIGFSGTVDDGGEGGPLAFSGGISADSQGYGITAILMYPVGAGFSVMGKAGGIHWDSDVPASVTIDGTPFSTSFGDDGTDFAWGAGLKYQINEHLSVDVQYETYTTIEDIELISGNAAWHF